MFRKSFGKCWGIPGGLARGGMARVPGRTGQGRAVRNYYSDQGRLRGKMLVDDHLGEEELRERALADPRIAHLIDGKGIAKVVVVPRKLVNIVLR